MTRRVNLVLAREKGPCLNCPERHSTCWGSCPRYKAFKEGQEALGQKRRDAASALREYLRVRKKGD